VLVDFSGPAGRLEGLLESPETPRFAAIVCHPHPRFGGTMHNHATFRLARALGAVGGATLRFHFRGVGRSEGSYDEGRGEVDDAAAALQELARRAPNAPSWVAGFSFGARVALALATPAEAPCDCAMRHSHLATPAEARPTPVHAALVIGVAVRTFDHGFARSLTIPVAAVQAELDEFGAPREVAAALGAGPGPFRLGTVPGARHLFTEDLDTLEAEIERAAQWLLEETTDGLPPRAASR